jgi:hypothetical protein
MKRLAFFIIALAVLAVFGFEYKIGRAGEDGCNGRHGGSTTLDSACEMWLSSNNCPYTCSIYGDYCSGGECEVLVEASYGGGSCDHACLLCKRCAASCSTIVSGKDWTYNSKQSCPYDEYTGCYTWEVVLKNVQNFPGCDPFTEIIRDDVYCYYCYKS